MFYSEAILSKKGPLAKVWLAAHWERKLSKNQFLQTNIHNSVDAIMGTDQAPMALRLSGQLLLGVARIYSRKTKYLLEDCNEALVKIKVAFRSDASAKGDSTLLMLDGDMGELPGSRSKAAFNAITVPDAMTEFDLLLPAQTIDIDAWGLHPKPSQITRAQDRNLEEGNIDDLFAADRSIYDLDSRRRSLGLDIEIGRNQMNRIGAGGYSTMDFDLAGPDDALDLDMFRDEVDFDFMKRPHRRDDLEIEVGRREATRRSVSVDPFAMMDGGKETMRLGSEERAPSVARSMEEHPIFQDGLAPQERDHSPFEFGEVEGTHAGIVQERQSMIKKRKLIVDSETEVSQELLLGANGDFVAEGLLIEHEMLPRSRKLLRLQQIEQDMAHGGLAGYLLDCSAGPRIMGGSMVPELASMFSRHLRIDQTVSVVTAQEEARAQWHDDNVGAWVDEVEPIEPEFGMHRMTPPPATDLFDGFQLESPRKELAGAHIDETEGAEDRGGLLTAEFKGKGKSTLFQDQEDISGPITSTKELNGMVFSTSTIQAMRLIQQGIESKKGGTETERPQRATRTSAMATASSTANKDNLTRVKFSELLDVSNITQQRRTRTDAAKLFFELLVLSTKDVVKVEQKESYGEIDIGGSPLLDTLVETDATTANDITATTEVEVSA
ncbi:sister chromatid cohesion protein 1 [Linnemannia zychae]|nr:sister chromatid cohesion protein 1 [Linnemannia zychae]